MKKQDTWMLVAVIAVSAIVSFFIAGAMINPEKYSTKVPTIQTIDQSFPDVKNDPNYNSFLNPGGLDLTVPVQIGDSQNSDPFSGQ